MLLNRRTSLWINWSNVCNSIRLVGIGRIVNINNRNQKAIFWNVRGWRSYQIAREIIDRLIKCTMVCCNRQWVGHWLCGRRVRGGSRGVFWFVSRMGWILRVVVSIESRECGCRRSTVRDISSIETALIHHR
jgi:hypothetical protein